MTEKTVTWSALISLGNGETIGLVVAGAATTPDDGRDIAAYAAGQLLGLAKQADDAAGPLIQGYVRRVFGVGGEDLSSAITAEKQDAAAAQAEEVLATEKRVAGATERPHPDAKPERAKAPAPQPAPSAPPTPEASTVATAPDAPQSAPTAPPKVGSGAICEKCGEETSLSQAKLSQLFADKTLCKKCLETMR